jgi:hypothetical protein
MEKYKSWVRSLPDSSIYTEKSNLEFMLSDSDFLKKIKGLDNTETMRIVSSKLLIVNEIAESRKNGKN